MKDTDYAFCVARIRANETNLLSAEFIKKLVEAECYEAAVRLLETVGWIEGDTEDGDFVRKQSRNLWKLLSESVPDKKVLDYLCVLNDYFNIKTAIKCVLSGENADKYYAEPSSLPLESLCNSIDGRDFDVLKSESMRTAAKNAFETACITNRGQDAEMLLDVAALNALLEIYFNCKYRVFADICAFIVDSSNVRTAIRCAINKKDVAFIASALSDCCKIKKDKLISESVSGLDALREYLSSSEYSEGAELYFTNSALYDNWCEKKVLDIATGSGFTAFGFDPVCAYFYKKNNEIKTVKLILSAKKSGVPTELLRERVMVAYA